MRLIPLMSLILVTFFVSADDAVIRIDARAGGKPVSRYLTGACIEDVNHEIYGGIYSQMLFGESFQEPAAASPVKKTGVDAPAVSGMWSPIATGAAKLGAILERDKPFIGTQSQRLVFTGGEGEAGIANEGLNHQGLAFTGGKPYEGYLWVRAEKPTKLLVSFESRDGSTRHAEEELTIAGEGWRRYDFALTPRDDETAGRFAIRLRTPGSSIVVGHAFLQPGSWGRFKGLPLRRDVVQGLIDQGITVLRYGGSMVNAPEYRWKKMIGPRDRRPPYEGHWYPYSSNGWGIADFLNLCDPAGFLGIPDFSIDESPRDMADFIEYANGPADSEWGRRRAADGRVEPYRLKYIELGNEEAVNDAYFAKFAALAPAIWAKDPAIILVVGDFAYTRPITDSMKFAGADSHITSLAAHRKILELAKQHDREVWFDVHIDTDKAEPSATLKALPTYIDAIDSLAYGARHQVVVFELNANNPRQRRALGNAVAIGTATRDGRLPVVTSANCLQVDGQNDNGWNQGLLFLNPSKVWLQPPGYVTQMIARSYEPIVLPSVLTHADGLDVTAVGSEDGKAIVLRIVNLNPSPTSAEIRLDGFAPSKPIADVTELSGPLDALNTAAAPDQILPKVSQWMHGDMTRAANYTLPAHSFTVLRFE